eukprot:m.19343 g.19343  ORF g.19343 m.19343 type:complete len:248 (+) comp11791_c0_seq2:166-909(+)
MYMQTAATSNTVCGLQLVVLYWDCDSCGCVVSHFFVRMDVAEDDFALGSALWKAAESGDTATAHRLLTSHANPTRLVNRKYVGWTPLQNAAVHGRTDVAALLLTHNAIVNATDIEGCTPLILAARNDQSAMVHLLLGQDADFYATTNDDYVSVHPPQVGSLLYIESSTDSPCRPGHANTRESMTACCIFVKHSSCRVASFAGEFFVSLVVYFCSKRVFSFFFLVVFVFFVLFYTVFICKCFVSRRFS